MRLAAYVRLLAMPELFDASRTHGPFIAPTGLDDLETRRQRIWQPLVIRWAQHRYLERDHAASTGGTVDVTVQREVTESQSQQLIGRTDRGHVGAVTSGTVAPVIRRVWAFDGRTASGADGPA